MSLPNKTINYKVDAFNRRMAKMNGTVAETYYLYNSDGQLIGTASSTGILTAAFVYGSKSHIPDYMITDTAEYQIISDHLGSPVVIVNSTTGVVAQEIRYDEYGVIIADSNPGFTPFGFAGCLYDQDTKLCRFGARDYDSSIGRWLSKDPILFAGGDTNLYGYVMQDPVNFIDRDGLTAEDVRSTVDYVSSQTGLPNASFSFGTPNGSSGFALPPFNHILVSNEYAGKLSYDKQMQLLRTVYHELRHLDDGFFKSVFPKAGQHYQIGLDAEQFMSKNWQFAKQRCGGN